MNEKNNVSMEVFLNWLVTVFAMMKTTMKNATGMVAIVVGMKSTRIIVFIVNGKQILI